jgi:3-isopropylmalate/(R)-2-methylmalate dehydratase small subunit
VLRADEVLTLMKQAVGTEGYRLTVDLAGQTVTTPEHTAYRFEIDPFRKDCLYRGLDSIGLTLEHEKAISAYESRRKTEAPWLFGDVHV